MKAKREKISRAFTRLKADVLLNGQSHFNATTRPSSANIKETSAEAATKLIFCQDLLPDTPHAVPPPSTANTDCSLPNDPPRYIPLPTTLLALWNPAGSIHVCASSQINPVLLGAG